MDVEKLIWFNQGARKGRHHAYFFRLCTLKKRECAIPTGNYAANDLAVVFIQKRYTHIGT